METKTEDNIDRLTKLEERIDALSEKMDELLDSVQYNMTLAERVRKELKITNIA